MMKKMKKRCLMGILSALSFCAIGLGVGFSNNVTVSAATEDGNVISMVGAQVRTIDTTALADTDPAIRFTAKLSADAVSKIENDGAKAGMMIFPESYMDKYEAQTEVTDYLTFFENAPHFHFKYGINNLFKDGSNYYIRGSIGEVQFANLDREYIAIAYVKYSNGDVVYAPVDRSSARSVEYIASSALNNGQTYSVINGDGTTTTPVMDWLNTTAYKKYGVSYNKNATDGKYYGWDGQTYTYEELQGVLNINNVVEEVYALNDWDLSNIYAGENYSVKTDNLADLNVQYSGSNYTTMKEDGTVSFNGDLTTEQTVTVTARVGHENVGYFLDVSKEITVTPIPTVTLSNLQTGMTYDWVDTYMRIGNPSGYVARRKSLNTLRNNTETEDVATALDAVSSKDVVVHLTNANNYLYGVENLLCTRSSSNTNMRNLYTIEFWYYSACDTHAYFIALDKTDSSGNDTVRCVDFKQGLNKMTLEYEGSDDNSVFNFYLDTNKYPNEYFDLYIADMTITCEERAIARTDYYVPTTAEMLADGGYTWDFSNNNLLNLSTTNASATYHYLCEMKGTEELNEIRKKLVLDTRAYGNYALNLQLKPGGQVKIPFLQSNDKGSALKDNNGYVYEISFNAYVKEAGQMVLLRYNSHTNKQCGNQLDFQITDNGNGTYNYRTWIEAPTVEDVTSADYYDYVFFYPIVSKEDATNYPEKVFVDMYLSNLTIEMYEPMDEVTETDTITPIMMSNLNQGVLSDSEDLPVGGFIASGKTNDNGTALKYAYWLQDRFLPNGENDVTLDLYEFGTGGLAHNGKRFKSITVTIYYYVQTPATASRVYVAHDGHDKAGSLDLSTAGYKTATYTWGYDKGLLDLRYIGVRKTDGSFGRFCIGSIAYSVTYLKETNEEMQTMSYSIQTTASATPHTDGYTSYTAASVVAENATVTALSNSSLQVTTEITKAGVWLEVPSAQFVAGQNVHLAFDLTTDASNAVNGYATVKLYNDSGKMLDWAYPAGTTSKVNYDTTVKEKYGKLYVYVGLRDTKGSLCTISNITVDGDVTPTGSELFGGTKLMQLENQSLRQMQSYIIKTWDGEVLIIDGGEQADAAELARQIRAIVTPEVQADGGVMYWVDALFITHYHVDHIGAVLNMLINRNLYGDIGFKNVYYDFEGAPTGNTDDEWTAYGAVLENYLNWGKSYGAGNYTGTAENPYEDGSWQNRYGACILNIIAPTTGVIYETQNNAVKIQSLNRANFNCESNYGNNSTVVYKVETYDSNGVPKESVLFLGDMGNYGDTLLNNEDFREEIRTCRVIQMAHHGQAGTSKAFYQAIDDIRICLYPAPDWLFDVYNADGWGAGLGDSELIGTAGYATLTTRAWMREMGVRYSYTMADGVVTLG